MLTAVLHEMVCVFHSVDELWLFFKVWQPLHLGKGSHVLLRNLTFFLWSLSVSFLVSVLHFMLTKKMNNRPWHFSPKHWRIKGHTFKRTCKTPLTNYSILFKCTNSFFEDCIKWRMKTILVLWFKIWQRSWINGIRIFF